ncbi:MAG: hypothetical protein ACLSDQ_10270 [Adlercreutzia equolifaciens]
MSAYFFSQALTEDRPRGGGSPGKPARNRAAGTVAYVAYDHEPVEIEGARANNLSSDQLTANARAFCEVIAEAGTRPCSTATSVTFALGPDLRAAIRCGWPSTMWKLHRAARFRHLAVHQRRHRPRHFHRRRFECVARA